LINEYGDLETLLDRAGEIKQNKRRENLIEFADQARISRELVMLRTDTPLPIDLNDMVLTPPEAEKLMGFLKAMEFNTLTQRVGKRYDLSTEDYEASAELAAKTSAVSSSGVTESPAYDLPSVVTDMPPIDAAAYECVTDMTVLDNWIEAAIASGYVAIDTETDGLDAVSCRLVGVSLATRPGHACYIPLAHGIGEGLALADDVPQQLAETDVLARLKPLLQDASIMKILQNAKFDLQVLTQRKIEVHPVEDTMLMSYALAAGQRGHGMDELSELYLGHKPISIKELLGTGKSQITFDQVPLEKAAPYAAEDADITFRLWQMMRSELVKDRVVSVYQTTEKPLVPVIVDMEKNGISVDRNVLSRLSGEFAQKMAAMEDDIYKLAGETFNIASPKQLGDILFDKMGLPGGKKTKTGAWGTGADVLEGLAAEGHDLAAQVLEWRGLAKLKSTYTDALPEFINPDTGRIHTSYSLASTTTGRLASSDPNLQNIPIRTEDGRRIRTAFVAEKGNLLVSADYSQIELRLLAHIADIDSLRQAFADGQDIHAMTASEMFGVPLADMTPETRRRAKAINFGIIYGISAFGLANQLGISRGEASAYIKAYFEKFPGIKDYMEAVKQEAHAQGYVSTLFGRRIYLREIDSKIPARRAFAERAAINAPIQGTAADIIRRAMIAMPTVLKKKSPKSRMLLQVHDELIFEAPEAETDKLMQHVREVMQNACAPRLLLSVPLVVEAQAAKNWDEAH
jgi:DNA polymerase-1